MRVLLRGRITRRGVRGLLPTAALFVQNRAVNKETTPEEYWAGLSEEIGEPVRVYALARLLNVEEAERGFFAPRPDWALVFMSDSTLYIERGSSQNWLARLITTRQRDEKQERESIPVSSITGVTVPPAPTGLRRLVAGPEVVVQIRLAGAPGLLRMVLDRRGTNDRKLIDLLSGFAAPDA